MSKFDWNRLTGEEICSVILVATIPIMIILVGVAVILDMKNGAKSDHAKCVTEAIKAGSTAQAAREACTP